MKTGLFYVLEILLDFFVVDVLTFAAVFFTALMLLLLLLRHFFVHIPHFLMKVLLGFINGKHHSNQLPNGIHHKNIED